MNCARLIDSDVRLELLTDGCRSHASSEPIALRDILPNGMCPLAFHAAFPYFVTLTGGGWFTWVRPGDGVIVQCPNPENSVEMKVFAGDAPDEARVEVTRVRGECPAGHRIGDEFRLAARAHARCDQSRDPKGAVGAQRKGPQESEPVLLDKSPCSPQGGDSPRFCLKAVGAALPYLAAVASGCDEYPWRDETGNPIVRCGGPDCHGALIRIHESKTGRRSCSPDLIVALAQGCA